MLLAIALLLAGCAAHGGSSAYPTESVMIPPVAVESARAAPAPLAATLQLPPGAGPHPVVIVLHGCGGLSANQWAWADRLDDWGYGSLVLNSFSARGVRSVCSPTNQALVTRFDRSADVIAAARWPQTPPGVDGSRIAARGESHGGGTAIEVASRQMEAAEGGLIKGVVDYYGPCRAPAMHGTIPILVLAGQDDTWGDPAKTCTRYAEVAAERQPVTVQTYPTSCTGSTTRGCLRAGIMKAIRCSTTSLRRRTASAGYAPSSARSSDRARDRDHRIQQQPM